MKKRTAVMAFLLLSALLFSCFSPPAMAASGEVSDAVLIPLDDWRSGFGVAAVCSDGRLLTAGLSPALDAELAKWTGVRQLCAFDSLIIGLGSNGSVQAVENPAMTVYSEQRSMLRELRSWSGITQLACSTRHVFGLKKNGSLVVAGPSYFSGVEYPDFSSWTGIRSITAGSSEDGGFIVAIRSDGTVLEEGLYDYTWHGTPRKVSAVSCSGWQLLCLNGDGTVVSTGLDAMPEVLRWKDIVQVCAGDCFAAGLKKDGSVAAHGLWDDMLANELASWRNIRSLFLGEGNLMFGVRSDGRVLVSRSGGSHYDEAAFSRMASTVESWTGIARILLGDEQHVLALRTDGSLAAFGLPVPGSGSAARVVRVFAGDGWSVGLRDDGSTVCCGKAYEGPLRLSGWSNVQDIFNEGYLVAKTADGRYLKTNGEAVPVPRGTVDVAMGVGSEWVCVTDDGRVYSTPFDEPGRMFFSTYPDGLGFAGYTAWTDVTALQIGSDSAFGLKRDGTLYTVPGSGGDSRIRAVQSWRNVAAISMGEFGYVPVALTTDGRVLSASSEVAKATVDWRNIVKVVSQPDLTIGLRSDGKVLTAAGDRGSSSLPSYRKEISRWTDVVDIDASEDHVIAVRSDGTVLTAGSNDRGQCEVSGWSN